MVRNSLSVLLSKWTCEFISEGLEKNYQVADFVRQKQITSYICAVFAITLLVLIIFLDHLIIIPEFWPYKATIWRLGFVAYILAFSFIIKKIDNVFTFHRFSWFFFITALINVQAMVLVYEEHYVLHVIFDLVLIIMIYACNVLTFRLSLLYGIVYGCVGITMILLSKHVEPYSVGLIIIAYFSANCIGAVISYLDHGLNRHLYLTHLELDELAELMAVQARKDALTGVFNRRVFDEEYPKYEQKGLKLCQKSHPQRLFFIFADIDFFKKVNDNLDHAAGDQVLVKFARLLKAHFASADDAIFRFGGEEFLIVTENTLFDVQAKIHQLMKELNNGAITPDEFETPVTASFGLVPFISNDNKNKVLSRADMALYQAKENGRNQLVLGAADKKSSITIEQHIQK